MGQEDIIKLLKKSDKFLSRTEIATKLEKDPSTISFLLNKLLKHGEIIFEELDRIEAKKIYGGKIKRRMRIYKCP